MQGNEPHPDFEYPVEEFKYWQFADRFGWTPKQVDEQPAYLMDWILAIGNLRNEIESENQANGD